MDKVLRALVVLVGVILAVIGLGFLVDPGRLTSMFAIQPTSTGGVATLRGDLGGLFLGMASFTLFGALPSRGRWLVVPTVFLLAVILGRLVNLAFHGAVGPGPAPLIGEVVFVAVLVAARRAG